MVDLALVLTVHVLGAVEVRRDGHPVELGGPQQRAVIAHLALDAGRVVSVERLIDRLWGDDPPRTPLGTLQSYVSRLRRAMEPTREAGAAPQVLVSEAPGYVLQVPAAQVDVHQFRALVAEARSAAAAGHHDLALARFDEALALWRGPALGGVGPEDQVRSIIIRLQEERDAAREDRFEALLALGRHVEAVPRLQAAVAEQPLRERLWELLSLALYRSSRQADALRVLADARAMLLDELGLDPGPALRDLEARILAQDPTLRPHTTDAAPAPVDVVEAPPPARAELVGRSREWTALVTAMAAAAVGRPQLVLIDGEPGIGKSTLCDALLTHAIDQGWRTAVGRCVEPGLAPSLWPAIEIVRDILASAPTRTAPSADPTENPLRRLAGARDLGRSISPVEMADQFVALLDEMAGPPWVILVDDLHWADQATLDVVRLALERLGSRPMLVVGAHRPPEIVPESVLGEALGDLHRSSLSTTRIRMTPLDTAGVSRLVEITTGVAPSAEVAERVHTRAGGNPLFVTELARLAGERGLTDSSDVPDAIRDVVRSRLAGLPERATAELEVAAVLGERFDLRTAMAASERDPDACLDALDAAIVTRILVPEADGFRFAHALVRDAVLAEVSPLRLARLHHRAADAILATHGDGPDEAEPIAHHRLASAAFADPVVVAAALVRASDIARWRTALDRAEQLAEEALTRLASVPRTARVNAVEVDAMEALVSAGFRRNEPSHSLRAIERVTAIAERGGSDAALALVTFLNWGDIDEAEHLADVAEPVERARALASRTTDAYASVTAGFMVAAFSFLQGHIEEAAQHAAVAIDAAGTPTPDASPEHVPLVLLPVVAGMIAALRDEPELAREHTHLRAAAWLAERSVVDPTAAMALAFNRALVQALFDRPQAVLDELRDAPRTPDNGFVGQQLATVDVLSAWARTKLGDAAALADGFAAMAIIDASEERILRAALRALLADGCIAIDDAAALDLLEQARREALDRGEVWWLPEILRLQAVADQRFADGRRSADLLREAAELATAQGNLLLARRVADRHPSRAT